MTYIHNARFKEEPFADRNEEKSILSELIVEMWIFIDFWGEKLAIPISK